MFSPRFLLRKLHIIILILLIAGCFLPNQVISAKTIHPVSKVVLYFFWGEGCPHCINSLPLLTELQKEYPNLEIRAYEVFQNQANTQIFKMMGIRLGFEANVVPTFVIGNLHWVGNSDENTTAIRAAAAECVKTGCEDTGVVIDQSMGKVTYPPGWDVSQSNDAGVNSSTPDLLQSVSEWLSNSSNRITLGLIILGILLAASLAATIIRRQQNNPPKSKPD
jgi:thiol-disulfide isomerase/thioredoxin